MHLHIHVFAPLCIPQLPDWREVRGAIPGPLTPAGSNTIRIYGTQFAAEYEDSTVFKAVVVTYCETAEEQRRVYDGIKVISRS